MHSFYSSRVPSGENVVVQQQADALRRLGYIVQIFAQSTDRRERSKLYPLEAALTVATGWGPIPQRLRDFNPDVIHVHNLFPNFGKQWLLNTAAPVISSLHNYRPMCAAGTFYRDGRVCTDCADRKSSLPAIQHGCYKGRIASVPVALGQRFDRDPFLARSSAIVALSSQMSSIYASYGATPQKLHVLPHFLPDELDRGSGPGGRYWLYGGRLSHEKGILPLVQEWPSERPLLIAGQGELEAEVRRVAKGKNIKVLGAVGREDLMALMRGAAGVVFPSRWFEGFGLVYMEALAAGTPVLAWEPSVVASFIRDDGTGAVVRGLLSDALEAADKSFPSMRSHCRQVFERKYRESSWAEGIRGIYDAARKSNASVSRFSS
ncbi:glycosyltransferase involved in cell wall biosynthesis [Arthrobacter oryzae]|nr:glycosyltransferase involved in cell wall biosynthesis [Arthrobacter oryzae]